MRIVLLGAPGAGKGTVAKLLAEQDGSVPVSTGDLLRQAVAAGSLLGQQARASMERGELVPDRLVLSLLEARLEHIGDRGFILDGFPRTLSQAASLDLLLRRLRKRLDLVANLVVPEAVIIDRLATRLTCSNPACQEIYNLKSKPPASGERCALCGSPAVRRTDETEAAVALRHTVYVQATAPLVGHYGRWQKLVMVTDLAKEAACATIVQALATP